MKTKAQVTLSTISCKKQEKVGPRVIWTLEDNLPLMRGQGIWCHALLCSPWTEGHFHFSAFSWWVFLLENKLCIQNWRFFNEYASGKSINFDKLYWFLSMTHKYVNQSWKVQLLGFLPYSATQPNRFIKTFTMQAVLTHFQIWDQLLQCYQPQK